MALQLPYGIRVAGSDPIDSDRYIAPDLSTRDQLITDGRAFVGLQVYVSGATNKLYILKDMTPTWEEVGGAADISSLSTVLSTEISDRTSEGESLSTSMLNEISDRTSEGESLSTSILNEISDRIIGDESLSTSLSVISGNTFEIKNVMDDGELLGIVGENLTGVTYSVVVSAETSSRISGDELLSTVISTEISNRISGDTSLTTSLSSEISIRLSADTSLSTSLDGKLSGLTSNLLYWNSVTKAYVPYANNIAAETSGKFYLGVFPVGNADLKLNYTGGLYVNALSNYGIEGVSDVSAGVRGSSNQAEGVIGLSNNGDAGSFSSNMGYGVFGSSTSGVGGRFVSYGSTNALEVEGNTGVASWIVKSATLSSDDNNEVAIFTRITDGDGLYGVSGDIISIIDDPINTTYISGSTIKATIGSDVRIDMNPRVADSGTSVAYMFDTNTDLTSDGSKLLSLKNHGVDKFTVDKDGQVNVFNNKIVNVLTPTLDSDVANKEYVDAIAQGVSVHAPVHVVADSPIILSGSPKTIDGHIVIDGDFVLVAGQSNAAFNGIYVVTGSTWSRRLDADGAPTNEIELGDFVFVQSGITYNNTGWALGKTDAPTGQTYIIPDVDTQEWFKMSAVAGYTTDGQGIELSGGTTFYIELSGNTLTKSAGGLRVTDGIFLQRNEINSDILYWNSGSSAYTPYSIQSAGKFDISLGDPIHHNRLNYDGDIHLSYLYATSGVYGPAIGTLSNYATFSDTPTTRVGLIQSTTGIALNTLSQNGVALSVNRFSSASSPTSASLVEIKDECNYGTQSISSTFIDITSNPTTSGLKTGSIFKATIDSNVRIDMNPRVFNTVGAVAYMFDNNVPFTAAGSKLLSIRNSGAEKFYIDGSGNTWTSGVTLSSNTRRIELITLTSGVTTTWDMNLSCSAKVHLTGATTLSITNLVSGDNGTLIVIQSTTGNITFPSGSKYTGGIPPTLSGGGQLDILSFYYDGTNYYWNIGKNYE